MIRGLLRAVARLVWVLALVFTVTSLSFVVSNVLPGDPARLLVGPQASPRDVERARVIYALDEPLHRQYTTFLAKLVHTGPAVFDAKKDKEHRSCAALGAGLHLDLGYSYYYRKPVVDLLATRIPRSFELALAALFVQLTLGLGLGLFAASKRGTTWDEGAIGLTLVAVSAPTFLSGLLLQYVLAYRLRLVPYDGYGDSTAEWLATLVLPALTLGLFGAALYARIARDELVTLLRADFVRTARAKGASELRVLFVHALRVALLPIGTLAVLDLGGLVGGAVVTESLFRWPGLGQLAVDGLLHREGPVLVGVVLFASLAIALSTWVLDLLTPWLDPRLRQR
jgi:peptide/nickel transport system permease protein